MVETAGMSAANYTALEDALDESYWISAFVEAGPDKAAENPTAPIERRLALLKWLRATRFTSQDMLQEIMCYGSRSNLNRKLGKFWNEGLITYEPGIGAAKKLVLTTERGWFEGVELAEDWIGEKPDWPSQERALKKRWQGLTKRNCPYEP